VHPRPTLNPYPARCDLQHALHPCHVEHQPTRQGDTLAVVARSAGANGQGQAVARCHGSHAHHVGLVAHAYDQIGDAVAQRLGQRRAVPEKVFGQGASLPRCGDYVQAGELAGHQGPVDRAVHAVIGSMA